MHNRDRIWPPLKPRNPIMTLRWEAIRISLHTASLAHPVICVYKAYVGSTIQKKTKQRERLIWDRMSTNTNTLLRSAWFPRMTGFSWQQDELQWEEPRGDTLWPLQTRHELNPGRIRSHEKEILGSSCVCDQLQKIKIKPYWPPAPPRLSLAQMHTFVKLSLWGLHIDLHSFFILLYRLYQTLT